MGLFKYLTDSQPPGAGKERRARSVEALGSVPGHTVFGDMEWAGIPLMHLVVCASLGKEGAVPQEF